jgi:hypothetical protein
MPQKSWPVFLVTISLILGTAMLLSAMQSHQRLGSPGVKVIQQAVYDPDNKLLGTNAVNLPVKILDYESTNVPVTQLEYNWLPRDTTYGRRLYGAADGFHVAVSIVLMGADRTSIHQPQYCLPGQGWVIRDTEVTHVPMSKPQEYDLPVTKFILRREIKTPDGKSMKVSGVFVYWFVAGDELTADHGKRMWSMGWKLLKTGVLQRWAFVTFFSPCAPGDEGVTFERMKQLIRAATPEFQTTVGTPPIATK